MSLAPVMPKSAWRASPMPLTAQPRTDDLDRVLVGLEPPLDLGDDACPCRTGGARRSGRRSAPGRARAACSALRISQATLTSSSAWNVESEIRIVSPIPSASSVPRPTADFSEPDHFVPASVIAEVQRVGDPLATAARLEAIVFGHDGRLHRDLEVREVEALHQLDGLDRGGDERLDRVRRTRARADGAGSEPELTPIAQRRAELRGARRRRCATLSGPPMLPGFRRTQWAPASSAFSASV